MVKTRIARTPEEAAQVATQLGFPVAIKVLAEEITHKCDVGGVVLDLGTRNEVHAAAAAQRVQELQPDVKRLAIRPEDEPYHKKFLDQIDPGDIRFSFFGSIRKFAHLTQIDYDREMAFIAVESPHSDPHTIGVVRIVCDPDNRGETGQCAF